MSVKVLANQIRRVIPQGNIVAEAFESLADTVAEQRKLLATVQTTLSLLSGNPRARINYANAIERDIADALSEFPSVIWFGAIPDAVVRFDGVVSGTTITSASEPFSTGHIGLPIAIVGAGAGGGLHLTSIASVASASSATLAASAPTGVSGAEFCFGTDNSAAFDLAYGDVRGSGNSLHIPGGNYLLLSSHFWQGPLRVTGCASKIDGPLDGLENAQATSSILISLANPFIKIKPYSKFTLEHLHLHGLGTNTAIETFEQASYAGQIGIFAGASEWYTEAGVPADDYGVGGSGGLYMRHVTFSGNLGWGFYGYKLWGQSELSQLMFSRVGKAIGGDNDHYGAMAFVGESVDLNVSDVHIFGHPDGTGTGIKLGALKSEMDARDRFYLGPAHLKFNNILIEGPGHWAIHEYFGIGSYWNNVVLGAFDRVEIGEEPWISEVNVQSFWNNVDLSGIDEGVFIKAQRVAMRNVFSESMTPKPIYYWYPGVDVRGRNVSLKPSSDKSLITRSGEEWHNVPSAHSNGATHPINLCPDYTSRTGILSSPVWTFSPGDPEVFFLGGDRVKLYDDGEVLATLGGFTVGEVYTLAFRHKFLTVAYGEENVWELLNSSDTAFHSATFPTGEQSGVETFILMHFVAPTTTVKIRFANGDPNQTEWDAPFVVRGAHSRVVYNGLWIELDGHSGAVIGGSIENQNAVEHYGNVRSRQRDSWSMEMNSREASGEIGIGLNVRWTGSQYVRDTDRSTNACALLLLNPATGKLRIIPIDSSGPDQEAFSPSTLIGAEEISFEPGAVKLPQLNASRPVKLLADRALDSGLISVTEPNDIEVAGLTDGEVVVRDGDTLGSISMDTLASAIATAIKSGGYLAHTHNYDRAAVATQATAPTDPHDHLIPSSVNPTTGENWT